MTPPPTDDWSDLAQTWTDPTLPPLKPDPGLIRSVRGRDRLARLNFAAEVAGGLVCLAVIAWCVLWRGLPWTAAVPGVGFVAFALAATLWSRRGDPGLLTGTPQDVLISAIGQARTGRRWAWAGIAISLVAFLFVGAMQWIAPGDGLRAPLILSVTVFLAVCIGFYLRHAHRCQRRMETHSATLASLRDGPTGEP